MKKTNAKLVLRREALLILSNTSLPLIGAGLAISGEACLVLPAISGNPICPHPR
ncbi:MAG TPA: hypothetical protein VGC42_24580 [Kofleriaceae bacterium]